MRKVNLAALLGLLISLLVPASLAFGQASTVAVQASNESGTRTGITVQRGQTLSIVASGVWCMGGGVECGSPNGIRYHAQGREACPVVCTSMMGTLLGRVGSWVFPIGSSNQIVSQADGELVLLFNDIPGTYLDNTGAVTVQVNVSGTTSQQNASICGTTATAPIARLDLAPSVIVSPCSSGGTNSQSLSPSRGSYPSPDFSNPPYSPSAQPYQSPNYGGGNTPQPSQGNCPAYYSCSTGQPSSSVYANPYAATLLSPPSQPRELTLGGMWISPDDRQTVSTAPFTLHFAAHAYVAHAGINPPINRVQFTVWWPGLGPETGAWFPACTLYAPSYNDVYECTAALPNVPPGLVKVSFDVYDTAGNVNLSPHGKRTLQYSPPAPQPPSQSPNEQLSPLLDLIPADWDRPERQEPQHFGQFGPFRFDEDAPLWLGAKAVLKERLNNENSFVIDSECEQSMWATGSQVAGQQFETAAFSSIFSTLIDSALQAGLGPLSFKGKAIVAGVLSLGVGLVSDAAFDDINASAIPRESLIKLINVTAGYIVPTLTDDYINQTTLEVARPLTDQVLWRLLEQEENVVAVGEATNLVPPRVRTRVGLIYNPSTHYVILFLRGFGDGCTADTLYVFRYEVGPNGMPVPDPNPLLEPERIPLR